MASLGEFEFIDQFLRSQAAQGQPFYRHPLALGIGDDAALMPPLDAAEQVAVASDMLIEGRHYFPDVDPRALGHKVLAVNLSDLAAMGARPLGFTLSAGLREIRTQWITSFLDGLFALSREAECPLIGGDTTAVPQGGAEVFSVTVLGAVPKGSALRRDGLQAGDDLWVSGHLGDAAYAVTLKSTDPKLDWPQPRIALGLRLRGLATAVIDISDGLQSEVMHLLHGAAGRSRAPAQLMATLCWQDVPIGPRLRQAVSARQRDDHEAVCIAITGGDEYELLFGASPHEQSNIRDIGRHLGLALTKIGSVASSETFGIDWRDAQGQPLAADWQQRLHNGGFRHF
ncbi:MAG: thiamine-phosphate kinase [Burkholderiaceae bacterium]|nr:thiamine-phosphate kinase [Burkholderiaceae bacterium]